MLFYIVFKAIFRLLVKCKVNTATCEHNYTSVLGCVYVKHSIVQKQMNVDGDCINMALWWTVPHCSF